MVDISKAGTFTLGDRVVSRMGYGAMQLAGPRVFGPPKDRDGAIAVLREAVASGVNHIDTADFYGPHITNQIIREALAPYPADLMIVTKVGAARGTDGSFRPAQSPAELVSAVHENLTNLGVDVLDLVNLRLAGDPNDPEAPAEGSVAERFEALAKLQQQGLIRHLGISNVTVTQLAEAQTIAKVACVQNNYNLVHRSAEPLLEATREQGIAFVPYFPLGGFSPLQSAGLSDVAKSLGATPLQVALAWLLAHAPNILLIPGTSSVAHLRENLASVEVELSEETLAALDKVSGHHSSQVPHAHA